MSIRQRLVLLTCFVVLGLVTAVVAIGQLMGRSDATREAAARRSAEATVEVLARVDVAPRSRPGPGGDAALRAEVTSVLSAQVDTAAGYCAPGWSLLVTSPGPHGEPRPGDLPPDQREAVEASCRAARAGETRTARRAHPHDVVVIATRGMNGAAAFALVRVPTPPGEPDGRWPALVWVMVAVTGVLVVLAADALRALRSGVVDLGRALVLLQDDLRAEVPSPRARELATVADGLRAMAAHLADAHERERSLERTVAHQQRLAGLGRVVAGVAHEVRNPLTGIKLRLDAMRRRPVDARSSDDIAVCLGEVARLDALVGAMLLVARRSPVERSPVDLRPLLAERVALLDAMASEHGVEVRCAGDAVVSVPRDALVRVVDNVLRNAIEASPRGSTVQAVVRRDEGGVHLDVIDQGDGVDAGRRAELFEPFFTTKADGTGLGLWLSHSLAETMGGALAYGRQGAATVFTLSLPAEDSAP